MADPPTSRFAKLRRSLYPNEPLARPPRPGTSRQDRLTFILLIVVATTISVAGVVYAYLAYG